MPVYSQFSLWEFQAADIPQWWDGLSHLQWEECSCTPNLFAGYLFSLGSSRVLHMYIWFETHLRTSALWCTACLSYTYSINVSMGPSHISCHKHLCNESLWVFERSPMTCNLMKEWPHHPITLDTVEWLSNYSEYLISAYSPYYKINDVHYQQR